MSALRGCGLARYGQASRASTRHDVSCPAASKSEPRARTVHTLRCVSLVVAGTSPGWSALGVKRHYQRPLSPIQQSGQPGLCTAVCVHQHQGRGSYRIRKACFQDASSPSKAAWQPAPPTATQSGCLSSRQYPSVCRWMPGTGIQYCTLMHSKHARAA